MSLAGLFREDAHFIMKILDPIQLDNAGILIILGPINHTRICKGGECLGSICERIPGWTECSLSRGEDITPEMMCYVACRNVRNDTPCISTIQLETSRIIFYQRPFERVQNE
ncbi:hypothetical protein ACTXT7_014181 [Hymenolepis weldensis]